MVRPVRLPAPSLPCSSLYLTQRQSETLKIRQSIAFLRGNTRVLQPPQGTRDLSSLPSVRLCFCPAPKPLLTLTWLRGLWSPRASCCSVLYLEYSSPSCQMTGPRTSPRSPLKHSSEAIIAFFCPSATWCFLPSSWHLSDTLLWHASLLFSAYLLLECMFFATGTVLCSLLDFQTSRTVVCHCYVSCHKYLLKNELRETNEQSKIWLWWVGIDCYYMGRSILMESYMISSFFPNMQWILWERGPYFNRCLALVLKNGMHARNMCSVNLFC